MKCASFGQCLSQSQHFIHSYFVSTPHITGGNFRLLKGLHNLRLFESVVLLPDPTHCKPSNYKSFKDDDASCENASTQQIACKVNNRVWR